MKDYEWVNFKIECGYHEYSHPSGRQICRLQPTVENPMWMNQHKNCEDEMSCPLLNKRKPCDGVCHECDKLRC